MAQAWPKAKPKLTQEAFDEAVTTNIEDFDMSREDAIKSAIEEFNVQGYDMTGVVTNLAGSDMDSHPIALASQGLKEACDGKGSLAEALEALANSLKEFTADPAAAASGAGAAASASASTAASAASNNKSAANIGGMNNIAPTGGPALTQEAYVIAHKGGAMQSLLAACRQLQAAGEADQAQLLQALGLLQVLLAWLETRDAFPDAQGVELVHELLKAEGSGHSVRSAAAAVAEAAAKGVEETKCKLVEGGVAATLLELLQQPEAPLELIGAACGVVRSVTTADDERPPASKAFMHARVLAKSHAAIRVLLAVLRRVPAATHPATVVRVLGTVRQVAANEEICREFTDDGGVISCLGVLRDSIANKEVAKACLGALRQLAHSDTVKRLLAEHGAVELAARVVEQHSGADDIAEVALGLLGNMMLRQPEICTQAAEAGVPELVVDLMNRWPARAPVQRQACLVTRIMVARNPELRPAYLERGVEPLLRAAKTAHPASCKDVGSAALRDLGLDNYND
ncbi:hypothetical protein HYH02_009658 [Chlamydomonas schloesseri]|uniref:Armadillo repeat-containing protein 6 n=1 Tax=Chlamydomonas schloesseri TaxID=2026947 RepID=A0A835TNE5_9CHLO|nr:hypothetical protein HYH02_009658 [Chlamydomonas schloesseri]|eukprot:KAG2442170.1 hypothetical protein HYH02_009658 [Chlamydomonas schloesseri]